MIEESGQTKSPGSVFTQLEFSLPTMAKVKDKCSNRRIAITNLPNVPASKHTKLFNKVLQLVLRYGDVVSYEEEVDYQEGDAGFYLPFDKEKKCALGCVFVEYESASSVQDALKGLDGSKFGKNRLRVYTGDSTLLLRQCLGCSTDEVTHYLDIVGGDISKAAETIIMLGRKSDKSAGGIKRESNKVSPAKHQDALQNVRVPKESTHLSVPKEVQFNPKVQVSDEVRSVSDDDRRFYERYGGLVDGFINAVCGNATKSELREQIVEADAILSRETGSEGMLLHSNLVNRPSFFHNPAEGRTPLSYAVAKNSKQGVLDLCDLGADISKAMAGPNTMVTALTIAATNQKRDGTEMIPVLLSKGAKPEELSAAGIDEKSLGLGMRYWLDKARRVVVPSQSDLAHVACIPPMDRLHELDYAVVGQEAAIDVIQGALGGRFGNPQGNRKPLVMLLLGPPGHGKTYFSSNAARSLVGGDNFLFISCQSIRDDADLFGSRLGGSRSGDYSSDGQLTSWLRRRQGTRCIVFLDEFEKMQGLTSALGWKQDKKIYQSFLETWEDGMLTDPGSTGAAKIDCKQCVWILTSNWGQQEIIDFCDDHKSRMHKKIDSKDVTWVQKKLVEEILRPLCIKEFGKISKEVKALARRIGTIVPFLPFTVLERKVVAHTALAERFALYREPCIIDGPEEKRRSFGNLHLLSTKAFASYAADLYEPMHGAGGVLSAVQQVDGKFQMMYLRNQLGLSPEQKAKITNPKPYAAPSELEFWVHYDKESAEIHITQSKPNEDEDDDFSQCSDKNEVKDDGGENEEEHKQSTKRFTYPGAADDAF